MKSIRDSEVTMPETKVHATIIKMKIKTGYVNYKNNSQLLRTANEWFSRIIIIE